jgi:integrase
MVVDLIRTSKPDTEKKVRQLLAKMFRHYVMLGEVGASPVEGIASLHQNLTKPPPKRHQPAVIDLVVLRDYVNRIEFQAGDRMVGWALMLQAMTAQRSTEIAKAQWSEFNDDCSVWTIPRSRMKMSEEDHAHPRGDQVLILSRQAQKLVRGIPREDGNPWVFRTRSAKAINGHISIEGLAKRMQAVVGESGKHVPHGFRRALRSNALQAVGDDGRPLFAEHWIESVLDHQSEDKVKAAYTSGKPAQGMAKVLQWWADQLMGADK